MATPPPIGAGFLLAPERIFDYLPRDLAVRVTAKHNLRTESGMRKLALAMTLLLGALFSGCAAGPHQLRRTVDDWDREIYVESPWISAALWVIPVIPFASFAASFGDFFITDAYAFWLKDAFSGEGGTGFRHADVPAAKTMGSLVGDGTFLRIDGGN